MDLPPLSRQEIERYSRHLALPQISMRGQQRLKASSALVVGVGGLGSPAALYLAAAGVGKLGLVDYDRVDISNLQRQVIHDVPSAGELKVFSAAKKLAELNPEIQVNPYPVLMNSDNALEISEGYDIIVDGSDNIPTRYLLNDLAILTHRIYIYGSIYRFEGQVSVFGADGGPCYRCMFPEPPPPGVIPTCSTSGVMGVLPGIIGSIEAAEVIKIITGAGNPLTGRLLLFDALDMSSEIVKIRKRDGCPVCGNDPVINGLQDYEAWCGSSIRDQLIPPPSEWDIEPEELSRFFSIGTPIFLLDVREPFELQISSIPGAVNIPYPDLEQKIAQIPNDRLIVVFCRNGIRSMEAMEKLRKAGRINIKHLYGGINAWAEQVDPSLAIY